MKFFLFTFALLYTLTNAAAENESNLTPITPTAFTAKYEATWKSGWFPVVIEAERKLTQLENGHWNLTFEAYSSIADLHEGSEYVLEGAIIKPLKYRYKTSGFLSKRKRGQVFDWDKKQTFVTNRDEWANYELTLGTQDNLSYQEQIRLDLIAGKKEFDYQIAYKNRLKSFQFKVDKRSKLKTKQGTINTVEVIRVNQKKKASTRIWFATDYDYLLVKLKNKEKNGDSNVIELKHAQVGDRTLQGF